MLDLGDDVFTRGRPHPMIDYRLRMAVDKARDNSMPMENIKRAIERATGAGADAVQFEEITYEGLGPANVAVIVATMTDNRNRTASEVRSIFTKMGGSLTPACSASRSREMTPTR